MIFSSNITNKTGFTLIETIVYIGLFAILISGVVATAYSLIEGGNRNKAAISIQEEGTFLNRKINWALSGASDVCVTVDNIPPCITTSSGGNTLTITRPDLGAQSPLVIIGNGMMVTIARGVGGLAVQLNSDRFPVSYPALGSMFVIVPAINGRPASITSGFVIQSKPFIFRTYLRQ